GPGGRERPAARGGRGARPAGGRGGSHPQRSGAPVAGDLAGDARFRVGALAVEVGGVKPRLLRGRERTGAGRLLRAAERAARRVGVRLAPARIARRPGAPLLAVAGGRGRTRSRPGARLRRDDRPLGGEAALAGGIGRRGDPPAPDSWSSARALRGGGDRSGVLRKRAGVT